VGILPAIDAVVAALQLKEVQLLRAAMRAADRQSKPGSLPFSPAGSPEPRPHIHPEPRFDPRPVIHPTPRFEPRPVIHPTPRIEAERRSCGCASAPQEVVVDKTPTELPLKAPWQTVPWAVAPQPAPKVKLAPRHPDTPPKGVLLDFFI
jgi:hypothetical protein